MSRNTQMISVHLDKDAMSDLELLKRLVKAQGFRGTQSEVVRMALRTAAKQIQSPLSGKQA